jgi:hypothetical protein
MSKGMKPMFAPGRWQEARHLFVSDRAASEMMPNRL